MVKETNEEKDTRRSFEYIKGSESTSYYLAMPNSEQIRKADWHYSKMYNKALVDGVTTQAEMIEILKSRGLYGPEHDQKVGELQTRIAENILEMGSEKDSIKRRELAIETAKYRNDLYLWNQRLTGPLSNTCEQMAEDSKTEYLTSVVIQKADGSLLWESYDDFLGEPDQALSLKARYEVLLWLQGLEPDFLDNTPENQVLKDLDKKDKKPAQLKASEEVPKDNPKVKTRKPRKRRKKAS